MKRSFLIGGIAGAALTICLAQIARPQSSLPSSPPARDSQAISGAPQGSGGGNADARTSLQPLNINVQKPARPDRDPNGLYQFGEKIALVEMPRVDMGRKLIYFGAIKKAPTLNLEADFEYQNYVLHYQKASDELIVGGTAQMPNRVFADVICQIVSVKE